MSSRLVSAAGRVLALVLFVYSVPFAAAPPAAAQVIRVADEVAEKIATPRPYPRSPDPAAPAWSATLHWAGASFIVAHFATFDLAPGDEVVVRDPAGNVIHKYAGRGYLERGGDFWALSVQGDTAVVELFTRSAPGDAHAGLVIDRWTHGYSDEALAPEAICGVDDARDVECYRSSNPAEYQKARAVVRLLKNGAAHCTGWVASCQNHLVTNQHCVGSQSELDQIEFQFDYKLPSCAGGTASVALQLQGGTLLEADQPLDYALILPNLAGSDPQATYGFLQWDVRSAIVDEKIYIPGHPNGRPKQLSLNSTDGVHDQSGRCEVWSTTEPACQTNGPPDVGYYCDTEGGSSGSPVLALTSNKVVALHHCASCPNRGVPIRNVYDDIQASPHPLPACSVCDPAAPPTNLATSVPGPNQVRLTWNPVAGATTYYVYRSKTGCSAGFKQVGSAATTTFLDTNVSGGVTYSYQVRAVTAACNLESDPSNCSSQTATGPCGEAPEFAGLAAAANAKASTCGVDLSWAPATPACGTTARYNVYRSTTPGFVPGAANRVAACVSGTGYRDSAGLANGVPYAYVVRAEDGVTGGSGPCNGGHEEGNTVEKSAAPVGPDDVYFSAGFESAAGWVLEGEWQIGAPQGKGGSVAGSGNPDPSSAFAGAGVLGTDLAGLGSFAGNYEDNVAIAQYATGPVFDATGRTKALLRFQRWLGVEQSTYDKATLDVFDGTAWQNVYVNPNSSFSDGAWTPQEFDVTAQVAGRNNARIRFGLSSDVSIHYCGWNVDALEVYQPSQCTSGAAGVPPVPDGRFAAGAPMTAVRAAAPGQVAVTWDVSRCTSGDYNLLYGDSAALAAYTFSGAACALGTGGTATVAIPNPAPGTFTWWTVAGVNGATEGHHGYTSAGAVRPASGVGFCSVAAHDASGSCP